MAEGPAPPKQDVCGPRIRLRVESREGLAGRPKTPEVTAHLIGRWGSENRSREQLLAPWVESHHQEFTRLPPFAEGVPKRWTRAEFISISDCSRLREQGGRQHYRSPLAHRGFKREAPPSPGSCFPAIPWPPSSCFLDRKGREWESYVHVHTHIQVHAHRYTHVHRCTH